ADGFALYYRRLCFVLPQTLLCTADGFVLYYRMLSFSLSLYEKWLTAYALGHRKTVAAPHKL
ncbi:MAG: hypothetical protein PUE10_00345, partial [Bacteroidales bacterium]|nr:hypothetical protein [Bacteroidales bacterium]